MNKFINKVHNGLRDGAMSVNGNQGSAINYEPNSFGEMNESPNAKNHSYKV